MEDESRVDSSSSQKPPTFSEFADELCAYYMALGMPYDDYWYGDYTALPLYERAHSFKNEQRNQELWLQGLYIYHAMSVVLHNSFKKKGAENEKYMQNPIRITPMTEREKQINAEKERQKIIDNFTAWGNAWKKIRGDNAEGVKPGAGDNRPTPN